MDLPTNLRETTLAELIQIIEVSGRSGRLQVQMLETSEQASIYFNKGQIVHATTNINQGINAIWELFSWTNGQLIFHDGVTTPPRTIKEDNISLIQKGLKKATNTHNIMMNLPPLNTVLTVNNEGAQNTGELQLDSNEWNFLILVDGTRSIKDLFDDSNLSTAKAAVLVNKLLEQKVIVPK